MPKPVTINWPAYTTDTQQYLDIAREMTSESIKSDLLPSEDNLWGNIVPSLIRILNESQSPVQSEECITGYGTRPQSIILYNLIIFNIILFHIF